ncbi:MAG: WD40/YVTN/BNR-like repeat-containing protein, partial [Burkholderiales bacterium]
MNKNQPTRLFAGAGYTTSRSGEKIRGGLFRRVIGEGDWQIPAEGLPEQVEARAFAFHPAEPDVIYAGTQDGPYRSIDGGVRWERLGFPERGVVIWSLVFHPTRPKVMYAGAAPAKIYRSVDSGDTWQRLESAQSPEYCPMRFPTRVTGIAVDAGRPDDVYASLEISGVIASRDGGDTWADRSAHLLKLAELPHLSSPMSGVHPESGMIDAHSITVSGASSGTAFLAVRMGLFKTEDGGANWQDMQVGRFSSLTYCRHVVVSPHDPCVMYAGLSDSSSGVIGSLYRSDDIGSTWQRFDRDIKAEATMMSVSIHPRDADKVYCASRSGQVFGTEDAGSSWKEYRLPDGVRDVYTVACS